MRLAWQAVHEIEIERVEMLAGQLGGALRFGERITMDALASRYGVSHMPVREALRELQGEGLVQIEPDAIQVTATGWYVVRAVAMVFDRWLQGDQRRERFSRMI